MRGKEQEKGLSLQALKALALISSDRANELAQANTDIDGRSGKFREAVQRKYVAEKRLLEAVHTIQSEVIHTAK